MSAMPWAALNDRDSNLGTQRFGAREYFLRIVQIGGRELIHHFRSHVTQHAFGTAVEDLNDAPNIRRNDREGGTSQDRVLQCFGLEQRLPVADLD
jgi:hypothetical protein